MAEKTPTEKNGLFDANSYVNNSELEQAWAMKTVEHMETHFNLISSVRASSLRLTPHDDEIYETFMSEFPNFKLDVIEEDSLKSTQSKEAWRNYCQKFLEKVEDASFGTLLRLDCSGDYSSENTILVIRIQFLAIEIARNRKGLNDPLCKPKEAIVKES